ncbi:MAG: hypothetical protein OQK24_02025 [Magnetovibrio sp.]|nr:hypothetical protein [Magnetovibrio sp.]
MLSFLTLAVLVGMSHALETDHVAAVSSMATRQSSMSQIVRTGAVWGLGHTITLMLFAGAALILGYTIHDDLAAWLEFCVGIMLMGLGGHIIYRLIRDRVHFHVHSHHGEKPHFHAHSHAGEKQVHKQSSHEHEHKRFPMRVLLVGMMHGMAGSAALLILTASTAPSISSGLMYVTLFGVGSIFGMAALSAVIAVPIAFSAKFLTWANRGIQATTGTLTMALGLYTMYETQLQSLITG